MSGNQDHNDDNFVMREENQPQGQEDDREEYFEAPATRMDLRSHVPVVVGAVGLILVTLIVWLFLSGGRQTSNVGSNQKFESRLTQLEEKLAKLEWLDQGLARLDKQEKDFVALTEKVEKMEAAYKRELAKITQNVSNIDKRAASGKIREDAPAEPAGKKIARPAQKVHVVKAGDTLYGISKKYGVDLGELRSQNNLSSKSDIFPGQKLNLP